MKVLKISYWILFIAGPPVLLAVQDIPEEVRTAFENQFPKAIAVMWEQESENEWEADFKLNSILYSASYKQDGTWLATAYEIDKRSIPKKIMRALLRSFPHHELDDSEKLETRAGGAYEFELENGDQEIEVIMDLNGKILKTIEEPEEDEEGDP